jgi:hypothetical protein
LQEHPLETLAPLEFAGQVTAEHELVEKGLVVDAETDPEKPALQEHPLGTVAPLEFAGQATAEHELL